jgi:hypothetical protein
MKTRILPLLACLAAPGMAMAQAGLTEVKIAADSADVITPAQGTPHSAHPFSMIALGGLTVVIIIAVTAYRRRSKQKS